MPFNTTSKLANLKAKELVKKVSPANSHKAEERSPGKDHQDRPSIIHSYFISYGLVPAGITPLPKFRSGVHPSEMINSL